MEMKNSQLIPAPQEQVWEALNDPDVLKACIPGAESIERVSDTEYHLIMTAKVGPVSAKLKGKITLLDLNPPTSYTLMFEGQGGAAGFAKGNAHVRLEPDAGGTRLSYEVHAQVGGKLAQVGSRLIDGVANKMAESFFNAFVARFSEGPPQAAAQASGPETSVDAEGGKKGRSWLPWRRSQS